jgi:hypothetical protein
VSNVFPIRNPDDDDDLLGEIERDGGKVLIGCATVNAIVTKIETPKKKTGEIKKMFGKTKLIFTLQVIDGDYAGTVLKCYVRLESTWKYIPASAKIYRMACVALGRRLTPKDRITKALFLRKVFVCLLEKVEPIKGVESLAYTVVSEFKEKHAG